MQHIQDKEFDQLFKDKFDGAELEPSANLWKDIEAQLAERPRRVFPVWRVAAAVLAMMAVAAGILFFKTPESSKREIVSRRYNLQPKPDLNQSAPGAVISPKNLSQQTNPLTGQTVSTINPVSRAIRISKIGSTGIRVAKAQKVVSSVAESMGTATTTVSSRKKELLVLQPSGLIARPDQKAIRVKQEMLSLPVRTVPLPSEEKVYAAADSKGDDHHEEVMNENDSQASGKGIRNIGDLVNYVVDKVDKRDEKFLQFKTEDDNSSLVAINIGIIRFNTKKTHTNK